MPDNVCKYETRMGINIIIEFKAFHKIEPSVNKLTTDSEPFFGNAFLLRTTITSLNLEDNLRETVNTS